MTAQGRVGASQLEFIETKPVTKQFYLFFLPLHFPELNPGERV
jgi:hypothetical protein